jgi:hypothetical protein
LFAKKPVARVFRVKRTIVKIALAVGFLATVVYVALGQSRVTCEVCMSYQGRQACEQTSAADSAEALMQATSSACSQISSGVTGTIKCNNTRPLSSHCSDS